MDREGAIRLLPEPYARALILKSRGVTDEDIALELGIDAESVDPCLKLAEAKLATLVSRQTMCPEDEPLATSEKARAGSDE